MPEANPDIFQSNQDAFDTNKISVEEFNLANQTRDLLLDEIKNKTNSYINMNIENYL